MTPTALTPTPLFPAIYALTPLGLKLALRLRAALGGICFAPTALAKGEDNVRGFESLPDLAQKQFHEFRQHIFIAATGIAVRCIAPHLADKTMDPAVVALDQRGEFVISLLSGHLGGANELAKLTAKVTGGKAIITTATDMEGLPAVDLLALHAGLRIGNPESIKVISAALLAGEKVALHDPEGWLQKSLCAEEFAYFEIIAEEVELAEFMAKRPDTPLVLVSWREFKPLKNCLLLIPPALCLGVGCRKGVSAVDILALAREACAEGDLDFRAVGCLASAEIKAAEPGLLAVARELEVPLHTFNAEELAPYPPRELSAKAMHAVGLPGVCEPAARAAAGGGPLLMGKRVKGPVTLAVALAAPEEKIREEKGLFAAQNASTPGKLYVCGLGPGSAALLTPQAEAALRCSAEIFGYATYVDLLPPGLLTGKKVTRGCMGGEVARCAAALRAAEAGHTVALVSSGDAGIYGMAGLVLELVEEWTQKDTAYLPPEVEIIPGVPALCAAAAKLGAPLMHDFAVISLSDLLTPWELIEERLKAAVGADFVLVLYNPSSRGRAEKFARLLELLRDLCGEARPYGLVREAFRSGEEVSAGRLAELNLEKVDMLSLVIVGNSQTRRHGNRLLTPRGYLAKYTADREDVGRVAKADGKKRETKV